MASLSQNKSNGRRTIQFAIRGKRKSVRLGKMPQHQAESFRLRVEKLVAAKLANHSVEAETAQWLSNLDGRLYGRLAKVGLVVPRKTEKELSLGPFLDGYIAKRTDVKPATLEIWSQVVRNLKAFFGVNRLLSTINDEAAAAFKTYLQGEKLASTTVSKRLSFARMFFREACKSKLIATNPFADVSSVGVLPKERQRFVTVDEIQRLLEVCDPTWRTIFALSRFGGLRSPSEVLSLRWQDIDFDSGRMEVRSPKTEHHEGKESRSVPLFKELRPYLDDAFELAEPGAVYVVGGNYRELADTPKGWRNINLRTHALRLIERAGLKAWPRLFHNLRSSRETELVKQFPIHVVTAWLGNTPKIALKHYLRVTDQDFEAAAGHGAVNTDAVALQNQVSQGTAGARDDSQERQKPPLSRGLLPSLAISYTIVPEFKAEGMGFEKGVFVSRRSISACRRKF